MSSLFANLKAAAELVEMRERRLNWAQADLARAYEAADYTRAASKVARAQALLEEARANHAQALAAWQAHAAANKMTFGRA